MYIFISTKTAGCNTPRYTGCQVEELQRWPGQAGSVKFSTALHTFLTKAAPGLCASLREMVVTLSSFIGFPSETNKFGKKKKKKLISCTLISIKLLFCLSCYREQWCWDSWLGRQSLSLLAQWLRSLHTKIPRNQISQTSTVNTKKGPLASTCCISRWKYKTWTGQKVFLSKVQFLPPFRSRTLRHGRFYFISSFIIYAVAIA